MINESGLKIYPFGMYFVCEKRVRADVWRRWFGRGCGQGGGDGQVDLVACNTEQMTLSAFQLASAVASISDIIRFPSVILASHQRASCFLACLFVCLFVLILCRPRDQTRCVGQRMTL